MVLLARLKVIDFPLTSMGVAWIFLFSEREWSVGSVSFAVSVDMQRVRMMRRRFMMG